MAVNIALAAVRRTSTLARTSAVFVASFFFFRKDGTDDGRGLG